jgi:hypothetical protein
MLKRGWLLIGLFALPALAAPPARIELEFDVMRNGTRMAEVVERLEHGNGRYELTEHWKGRAVYALLGRATRVSKGAMGPEASCPSNRLAAVTKRILCFAL